MPSSTTTTLARKGRTPKTTAIYELISVNCWIEGVPVHGVGFQMHVAVEDAPLAQDFAAVAAQFSNLGLQVAVTEMDVKIQNSTQPLPETLDAQADLATFWQHHHLALALQSPPAPPSPPGASPTATRGSPNTPVARTACRAPL